MKRNYEVSVFVETDSESLDDGLKQSKEIVEKFGLKVYGVKPVKSQRTLNQNNALHLLFTQLADDMNDKGIDFKTLLKVPLRPTPYLIKEEMWKPLQKAMLGKVSTTELDKTEDINLIYDQLNKILIERTDGNISLPPFPSLDLLIDEDV